MRLAVFTACVPEWTPEEAVEELAKGGWDGIEWRVTDQQPSSTPWFWMGNKCTWPYSSFLADVPTIRDLTASHGLAMPSLGSYVAWDQLEKIDTYMRGCKELGVPQLRVSVNAPDASGYRTSFDRARAGYREVEALAREHGVRALVETHFQGLISSASAAVRFVDGMDPRHVGVIYDIGNMCREGYEHPPWAAEMLGDYLAHVHVKNAIPRMRRTISPPERASWVWEWAPLRTGILDLTLLFEGLSDLGYDGWISVEDFSTAVPMEERLRADLAYLREILRVVGADRRTG